MLGSPNSLGGLMLGDAFRQAVTENPEVLAFAASALERYNLSHREGVSFSNTFWPVNYSSKYQALRAFNVVPVLDEPYNPVPPSAQAVFDRFGEYVLRFLDWLRNGELEAVALTEGYSRSVTIPAEIWSMTELWIDIENHELRESVNVASRVVFRAIRLKELTQKTELRSSSSTVNLRTACEKWIRYLSTGPVLRKNDIETIALVVRFKHLYPICGALINKCLKLKNH